MSETKVRVPGHTLIREGAPYDGRAMALTRRYGGVSGEGRGLCSCGALSDVLPSGGRRKQWHREHKAEVSR